MTEKKFEAYLCDRYDGQIKWFEEHSKTMKLLNYALLGSIIVLTPITTLLIGLGSPRILSGSPSALLGIFATTLRVFRIHDRWITYQLSLEDLRRERIFYDAELQAYRGTCNADQQRSLFVDRAEAIIKGAHIKIPKNTESRLSRATEGTDGGTSESML